MNIFFHQQLLLWLGLSTITVMGSGLSTVQAQPAPVPGTTATSAFALTPDAAQHETQATAATKVSNASAPTGVNISQTPNSTPSAPVPSSAPSPSVGSNFPDVGTNYWAYPFIQGLATQNVIAGFPDGSFRPEQPVTRAEFAAMLQKAFKPSPVRQFGQGAFTDVPSNYWAATAIQSVYEAGFLAGYPNNLFLPNQTIPKVQAITGLASGLKLTPQGSAIDVVNTYYTDAAQIPSYAVNPVAAATQDRLVVDYPDVKVLDPGASLSRAQAAAYIYQALVRRGQEPPLASNVAAANYIVGGPAPANVSQTPPTTPPQAANPSGLSPGRSTRGVSSYVGVAGNFGISGASTALGVTNVSVISKIGLLRFLSVRPSIVIGDHPVILLPITFDLASQRQSVLGRGFRIDPYIGAGIAINTNHSSDANALLTGGVDLPINRQFTVTAAVNAAFANNTSVGLLVGVGYNFNGF